ncbi:MAG: hypothetical protein WAX14_12510 [Rhodococcus sp. (in: high G+C Gram-positive bacteria)]|uniref:hypothetical protein n=1 Tax=Rhodococcus sp. TaxID=1831 RepID=UPI003BB4BD06
MVGDTYGLVLTESGKSHLIDFDTGRRVCADGYRAWTMHGIVRGLVRTADACADCLAVAEVKP